MHVITDPAGLPREVGRLGFVPTMGALHGGHISLVEAARTRCDSVLVSIFVNPTQFRPGEDYDKYPRPIEEDVARCDAAGVDYVFIPSVNTIYPEGTKAVSIHVEGVGDRWDGEVRAGHFDGVATVVARLLVMVRPDLAVFSVKDLQQCAVINRLVSGLGLPVELHFAPTLREADGLAMSSRNVYLSSVDRALAPQLYKALREAKSKLESSPGTDIHSTLSEVTSRLDRRFEVQYCALVNRETMAPTDSLDRDAWIIIAAKLGETRLIDNISLWK